MSTFNLVPILLCTNIINYSILEGKKIKENTILNFSKNLFHLKALEIYLLINIARERAKDIG